MSTNTNDKQAWFDKQEEIAAREARIAENQRIFAERVRIAEAARQAELEVENLRMATEREAKKLAAKQRQAANQARRSAESQALKAARNSNRK